MGKLNKDNLRKTIYYLKKNGVKNTVLAAAERLKKKEYDHYTYERPDEQTLKEQRQRVWDKPVIFSVVVPVYRTPEAYFREMIESVLQQTYPYFELILADAGEDEHLRGLAESYGDSRIRYIKLPENAGIAENTNQAIREAKGDYIALFDHDDLLTVDALYEMADALRKTIDAQNRMTHVMYKTSGAYEQTANREASVVLLYSDEDKCDGSGSIFYDPHFKLDYDQELLLTNNYFCHLTVVKADVAKKLLLRKAYDGAQDFDFVLRVTAEAEKEQIVHIPKVLYHWRCHIGSTAANPESKRYAYEAGKRAVEDYVNQKGWNAQVTHLKHLGFYRVNYAKNIFDMRPEIGAVGGRVLGFAKTGNDKSNAGKRNQMYAGTNIPGIRKIVGGMMDASGKVCYEGLPDGFSGYVNRAVLQQQAEALDIRCMQVNPACAELCRKVLEGFCSELGGNVSKDLAERTAKQKEIAAVMAPNGIVNWKKLPENTDWTALSLEISRALRNAGYVLVWDPEMTEKIIR